MSLQVRLTFLAVGALDEPVLCAVNECSPSLEVQLEPRALRSAPSTSLLRQQLARAARLARPLYTTARVVGAAALILLHGAFHSFIFSLSTQRPGLQRASSISDVGPSARKRRLPATVRPPKRISQQRGKAARAESPTRRSKQKKKGKKRRRGVVTAGKAQISSEVLERRCGEGRGEGRNVVAWPAPPLPRADLASSVSSASGTGLATYLNSHPAGGEYCARSPLPAAVAVVVALFPCLVLAPSVASETQPGHFPVNTAAAAAVLVDLFRRPRRRKCLQ